MNVTEETKRLKDNKVPLYSTENMNPGSDPKEEGRCRHMLMYSEPVMFLLGLAYVAFTQFNQQYLHYRIQRDSQLPRWIQDASASSTDDDNSGACGTGSNGSVLFNIQTEISSETAYLSSKIALFRGFFPIFFSLVICSLTDTVGRRFGLLLPTLGALLNMITYLIVEYLQAPLEWLYLGSLLEGLSGSHLTISACCYAYIYDTCNADARTIRFTLMNSTYFLASAVASIAIGYIIDGAGYLAAIWFLIGCYGCLGLYVIAVLPESLPEERRKPCSIKEAFKATISGFRTFFKPRPQPTDRLILISVLIIAFISCFVPINLIIIYSESPPFCLNSVQIGFLLALYSGALTVVPPIKVKLQSLCVPKEFFLFIEAAVSTGIMIVTACIKTQALLFITGAFSSLGCNLLPLCRAFMAGVVAPEEQGTTQAAISSLSAIGELVSDSALVAIYAATEQFYFGTVFFIIAFLFLVCSMLSLAYKGQAMKAPTLQKEETFALHNDRAMLLAWRDKRIVKMLSTFHDHEDASMQDVECI
ncbi:hypothetical protein CAPTEDRAFT_189189 [Capitella teleta]|uniref:Proton-coupled folate transporter n=1 Tax=Capitella teleta TaxID=283909 RepID=R7UP29_CAPTE|nr:hypothetical protein CAPTEDRAFT_189189 [Capitella teleta]|eukprot:ELU08284.1 hypothetical protein CAPTEDRAFT_189189 [Capitella teleta]